MAPATTLLHDPASINAAPSVPFLPCHAQQLPRFELIRRGTRGQPLARNQELAATRKQTDTKGGMEGRARRRGTAAAATGASPGRNKVWVEPPGKSHHPPRRSPPPPPPPPPPAAGNKVAVVYYLCRSCLPADVIDRLNVLKGKGMATMYPWYCRRGATRTALCGTTSPRKTLGSPRRGNEYILKGSKLLDYMNWTQLMQLFQNLRGEAHIGDDRMELNAVTHERNGVRRNKDHVAA